ncbi:hypothetical protein L1987_15740 [Smallanthus sonchifolius]|uniref:Uncharacterized protein n=1 Tax=Smallanthus sonchifolius TaxID=185202 RepID=A0ACB9J8I8_9ASTR|nr:hypothetical protein L1987_15740 [Smallanthus sonchifolius]
MVESNSTEARRWLSRIYTVWAALTFESQWSSRRGEEECDVLQHMPKYGKFLKDLFSNKKKVEEVSKVSLSERCSAVVQNKQSKKLADPGHFTIPCLLGGLPWNHALADLGASINLMPYSIYKQLDLGEPKPTRMSISLADRSDACSYAAKALIDVFDGKLTLRVGDESFTFDVVKSMKEVEELLDAPDDYSDEVPDDLLEMMAELEGIIGKIPSVGMVEIVKTPDDPDESLEIVLVETPSLEPLPVIVVHPEGVETEQNPSFRAPRSRTLRKRTRALIESSKLRKCRACIDVPCGGKIEIRTGVL